MSKRIHMEMEEEGENLTSIGKRETRQYIQNVSILFLFWGISLNWGKNTVDGKTGRKEIIKNYLYRSGPI